MSRSRSGGGFTLMEVLVATTLLAMVSVGVVGWISTQRRAAAAATAWQVRAATESAVLRLLRDDLAGGAMVGVDAAGGRCTLQTLHAPPGDPPGLHRVVWTFHPEGLIERSADPLDARLTIGARSHARIVTTTGAGMQVTGGTGSPWLLEVQAPTGGEPVSYALEDTRSTGGRGP